MKSILCLHASCIHGQAVAERGTCEEGDVRDDGCGAYRQQCPLCHGTGLYEAPGRPLNKCPSCDGWGYYR